jgi:hypothetical protein
MPLEEKVDVLRERLQKAGVLVGDVPTENEVHISLGTCGINNYFTNCQIASQYLTRDLDGIDTRNIISGRSRGRRSAAAASRETKKFDMGTVGSSSNSESNDEHKERSQLSSDDDSEFEFSG